MMTSRVTRRALGLAAVLLPFAVAAALRPPDASAADHIDGPSAQIDPAADISDVFAWMNADASRLNLVANVFYSAGPTAAFSPAVQYAFHIESGTEYGAVSDEALVLCQFYDVNRIECWAGDDYVEGDPSDPAGLLSASGRLRVFAGRRDDPFFMEFDGFNETVAMVVAAAPSLTFVDGCPTLDAGTQSALVAQLQSNADGAPASDTFGGQNVLSVVVQVDPALVNVNGPLLAVWASTHANPSFVGAP
ncbi:MAG: DUF4331 family protein [Sandaracinaceae bacterium]|nr:DUF4331 family protein [Sandaracinaceae bacterium]MBK6812687.1 DUF4331 family protein [Sandaracinaceae bacterium]MBK7155351.1 DUF4331 family protein [Sandaracinaceae bacterium]MBK7778631.1 DUF4331 family protein [Sandaracinaceae bacterium]MBK8412312.1 DUF4331 family protein [Sandaracinaceae bacterium]